MMENKFLIIAHTGCNGTPHNSIDSLLLGAKWGADVNEVDVRTTKDEIPILWHDDYVLLKDGRRVLIHNLNMYEISRLSQQGEIKFSRPSGEIIPLIDLLDIAKDKSLRLNLDLKDDECIVPVAKLVKDLNMAEGIIFSGCGRVRASYLKSNYPEFQVLFNVHEQIFQRRTSAYIQHVKEFCDSAIVSGCCGINIQHNLYTSELQEYANRRFLPIVVWTVGPEDGFEWFVEQGVHSITTLKVKELVALKQNLMGV